MTTSSVPPEISAPLVAANAQGPAPESLISALLIDAQGHSCVCDPATITRWQPADGMLWLQLDYKSPETRHRLESDTALPPVIVEALLAEDTRPRCLFEKGGVLIILRGINLNPGQSPDDMVSIRLWSDGHRILSVRHRYVAAADDLLNAYADGPGPASPGEFLDWFVAQMALRMNDTLNELFEVADSFEDDIIARRDHDMPQTMISSVRRQIISFRRYLLPQRDALAQLAAAPVNWLDDLDRGYLRETVDRLTRYLEELETARDRLRVAQDELDATLARRLSQTMYFLSIVTAIFLPLTLLSGLLGMNVGGVPGNHNPYAFGIVCGLLVVIAGMQLLIFKRVKWL